MFSTIWNFMNYWYFRYLMVTELYMVEKWERIIIHVFFLILFLILSYFNHSVLLSVTSNIVGLESILPQDMGGIQDHKQ